jgi:glycerol-3-phosphate dehydrogenase
VTVPHRRLPTDVALVLPVAEDRRSIFVVPWPGTDRVYLGTTDTDYDGPLDRPTCTPSDVEYLLRAVNAVVSDPVTPADVVGTWAGLRPLVASAPTARSADLSRRHRLSRSPGGVVSVTGGKLTTYRRMAADTVDEVVAALGRGGRSRTARLPLRGAGDGHTAGVTGHLESRYGAEAGVVRHLVDADPDLGRPLVPSLPYLRAEAVHAARSEMARSVTDVLARRTRALVLERDASAAAAGDVARLLAPELGWTDAEAARQAEAYRALVAAQRHEAGLPEASRA